MKILREILYKISIEEIIGDTNIAITDIIFNTNKVSKDTLFVAIKGTKNDSHNYIDDAISLGASAILCEQVPSKKKENITYIKVTNSRIALAFCCANFFNNPSKKIKLVGITGTNGKTSVATLLFNLFDSLKIKSGLISTIENKIHQKIIPSALTTPDPYEINLLLNEMVSNNCEVCFMEVSSHGISQSRIEGLKFCCGVFTNISRDHLDYHLDFDDYILTKKKFFDSLGEDAIAIINKDDRHAETMLLDNFSKKKFYSLTKLADYCGEIINNTLEGVQILLEDCQLQTKMPGIFNAYNLLAVYTVSNELGQNKINILALLPDIKPVPGRFNIINSKDGIIGIIDYAHSPGSLEKVFETINHLKKEHQKIITVLGCGGNRDVGKRPIMGKISYVNSDVSIFTSDNPRYEKIDNIISDMASDIIEDDHKKLIFINDRGEAILKASQLAKKEDIILILGKGHEVYQEIQGEKKPFDDYNILTKILQ